MSGVISAIGRELGGTEFDILTMKVTASGIEPDIDTVFAGLQLGNGIFDVSPDGERLVYYAGSVETSLSTIDVDRTPPTRLAATQVLSSTTLLRGRISPAGDKIFLARDAREVAPTRRSFLSLHAMAAPSRSSRWQWRTSWIFSGLPMAPGSCICTESEETRSG